MAINNSHKPIGADIGQGPQKTVGNDYGSRRQWNSNNISSEPQIQRSRDFFGVKPSEINPVETFESNAKFVTRQVTPTQVVKALEAGKKVRPKISDNAFLKYLETVIAGPGDNLRPSATVSEPKTPIKSSIKAARS